MAYHIDAGCVGCHYCRNECPAGAIRYMGAGYQIDPEKCTGCGLCAKLCHLSLIHDMDAPETAAPRHEKTCLDCDVLVIGAGGVGTGAAARAAFLGMDVILIEAAEKYGGGTYLAHGASFPASRTVYERLGIEYDLDKMMGFWNFLGKGKIRDQEALRRNIMANGQFLDWFDSLDPEFCSVFKNVGKDRPFEFDMPEKHLNKRSVDDSIGPGWTGSWVTERLFETAVKYGARYFNRTRARRFIMENGRVAGVLAEDPGGEVEIRAGAFVLATGPYLMNDAILNAIDPCYVRPGASILRLTVPTNVGDGHEMAAGIGAKVDVSYARTRGPVHHPYSYAVNKMMLDPENVYFSEDGDRFFEIKPSSPGLPGQRIVEKPDSPGQRILHSRTGSCWLIMDSDQLRIAGERLVSGIMPGFEEYLSSWREAVEEECALEDRPARRGDSLTELSRKLGMVPGRLEKAVERWNELCDAGEDTDMGKAPEHMRRIEKPPFYAFIGQNFDNGASIGGVEIDGLFRVVDENGRPFDGLYCAGDCASYSPEEERGPIGLVGGLGGSWASGYQIANYIKEYLGK